VIAASDDTLVVAVNEHGRGKASGAVVVRTTYGLWTMRAGRAIRIIFFETRDEALEAAGLSE
jgi:hypothetical protein